MVVPLSVPMVVCPGHFMQKLPLTTVWTHLFICKFFKDKACRYRR